MHYRGTGRAIIYAVATAALSLGLLGGNTYAQSLANDIGSENMLGVQFVQAGPALAPTQAAGVIPQNNFNPVFINNSTGTSGTTGDLVNAFGADTGITLTHISNDGYNSNVETTTPDGILLHGEDKTGPAGRTLSNNPGLTSTYTFNNVPNGNYALVTYTENDWAGVNANLTVGATTNYITDQAVGGVPDAAPQSVPAFLSANNTNPNTRVTGNYVTFNNVTPANGQITLTNTSEGGANDTASVNGFQLISLPVTETVSRTPASSLTTVYTPPPPPVVTVQNNIVPWDNTNANEQGLLVYSNGQFSTTGTINRSDPTVVVTHGWGNSASNFESFAQQYAAAAGPNVNIVAWNWSTDADTGLTRLDLATSHVLSEGDALGKSLLSVLGNNYSQTIHFVGHSLGTMVNAEAVNVFDAPTSSGGSSDGGKTQITNFDDAAIANEFPTATTFAPAVPAVNVAGIDNYVSAFGNLVLLPNATNVILNNNQTAWPHLITDFHSYPISWYASTLLTTLPVGYAWALDNTSALATPLPKGQFYEQGSD